MKEREREREITLGGEEDERLRNEERRGARWSSLERADRLFPMAFLVRAREIRTRRWIPAVGDDGIRGGYTHIHTRIHTYTRIYI